MLPGAHYTQPDPETAPLDQAADLLQQRVKRAGQIATNPWAQVFAPEQAAAAREFVPKAAEALQKIETQKAAIASGRVQARTLGLEPGEVSDYATLEDRLTVAQSKALKGDMRAFQGIQAVRPDMAAAIAPQVHEVVAGHLSKAQLAFDSLASMQNEGQYQAKLRQLRQDGTLTDLESLGMKVPTSLEAFSAVKGREGMALREARIAINAKGQELEARNTYHPMEKKEQETYAGAHKTLYGDEMHLGPWSRNGATNTRGQLANGIATVDDYGKTGAAATPEQRKELGESFREAIPKEALEKIRSLNRIGTLATKNADGKEIPSEGLVTKSGERIYLNTNPNIQQGLAEGFAAALRGGGGGATGGLLNIETSKRGAVQALLDKIKSGYSGGLDTIKGEQVRGYLTTLTQKQQREVLDGLREYNEKTVDDRALQTARRAGALGLDVSALGLGKDEAGGKIADAVEEGRRAQVERMRPYFQPIGAGNGVLQLGAQNPGAGAAPLPPSAQQANQIPGAAPLLTPVQQNGGAQPQPSPVAPPVNPGQPTNGGVQQPPPPPLLPQPGGGGQPTAPQPVRVAGIDVNVPLPPGASPKFVQATAKIESGNEKDPWKAGTKNSSASGAFQFIDSTWKDNKPAGAPDRAKDATPEQQAEAFAKLTSKNAASLKANNLPVTDTSLYVMHNLGAGAGATLLQANPNADARSLVGEAAARNNPMFFKGRPTVATVLQRYGDAMAQGGAEDLDGPKPKPGAGGASLASTMARAAITSNPLGAAAAKLWDNLTPSQKDKVKDIAIDNAPAIGSTAGAIGGGLSPVPGGAIMGGAAGATAGQALKDYLKGNDQSPRELVKQGLLGGLFGVASAARPIAATAARVVGAGGVEAADEAVKGGDAADIVEAGGKGAGLAVAGEAFGRALGMGLHKVYTAFTPDAQKAVQAAAKKYAEADQIIKTEPNRIAGPGGTEIPNPKYLAAEQARGEAETAVKNVMPHAKMEEVAYAHKVTSEGVPKQEAQAAKPGALEQERIGQGYQQIEKEVNSRGVGAVKAAPKLADGPVAAVEAKKVSAAHAELADHVEMAITAPAKNWQEKWTQLKDARSDLLQAERDALGSTATGKTQTAKDMRTLADTVRAQQEKAAKYVFGEKEGEAVMQRLKTLDVRYRRLMEATHDGDLGAAARLKGEAGREADRRFRAFAHDDPAALAAWAAMRKHGPNVEKDVKDLVAAERIPVLGKVFSGIKLLGSFNQWMRDRAAGSPVKFSEVLEQMPDTSARTARNVAGTIVQRGAVQGDFSGATQ
jgi:hypothetical protein